MYFDDLIVSTAIQEEHDKKLIEIFEIARKNNVKFNVKKFQYCQTEVKYLGFILGNNCIKLDPEAVQAIVDMKATTNLKELRPSYS